MNESKRKRFEQSLAAGVFVYLDPRCAGVVTPPWVKSAIPYQFVLQFGHGFPTPIRDLKITDEGVSATLSFGGKPFHCVVPWESVWIMRSGDTVEVWQQSFPPEATQAAAGSDGVQTVSRQPKRVEKRAKRPTLTLIRGGLS